MKICDKTHQSVPAIERQLWKLGRTEKVSWGILEFLAPTPFETMLPVRLFLICPPHFSLYLHSLPHLGSLVKFRYLMYLGCRFYPYVYVEIFSYPLGKKVTYMYFHVPSTVKLGSEGGSAMSIVSASPQLLIAETCQSYIHTLRWEDRPLQCPRCQSYAVGPWGTYHYRSGCKRYRCRDCQRTFNDLTGTCSTAASAPWRTGFSPPFCCACRAHPGVSPRVGVHLRTQLSLVLVAWWNAALSYEMDRQVEGTVEADDLYPTAGHKGQAKRGGKEGVSRRRPRASEEA